MCICVCICANNMQILGFGGVGGVRSGGGIPLGGEGGGCGGPGTGLIYIGKTGKQYRMHHACHGHITQQESVPC